MEVQVPAAAGIAAQQHADYGYDHNTGKIHPDTSKYAHLKTVDYVVSAVAQGDIFEPLIFLVYGLFFILLKSIKVTTDFVDTEN